MTDEPRRPSGQAGPEERAPGAETKKRYTAPKLITYGSVAKLTQTGGISVKDMGSMKQAGT